MADPDSTRNVSGSTPHRRRLPSHHSQLQPTLIRPMYRQQNRPPDQPRPARTRRKTLYVHGILGRPHSRTAERRAYSLLRRYRKRGSHSRGVHNRERKWSRNPLLRHVPRTSIDSRQARRHSRSLERLDRHRNVHHGGLSHGTTGHHKPRTRHGPTLQHQGSLNSQIGIRHGKLLGQRSHRHPQKHQSRCQGTIREPLRSDKQPPRVSHRGRHQVTPPGPAQARTQPTLLLTLVYVVVQTS